MLRVFIISFLFLFVSVGPASADFCSFCKTSGCLIDYQTAKSDRCRSCQICLKEPKCSVSGIDNQCTRDEGDKGENGGDEDSVSNHTVINLNIQKSGAKNDENEKRCDESDDTAKCRDLRAQETVAKWAWPTWVVGLLGVGGLIATILQSRRAIKEATESNRIANAALGRDRAWFLPDSFDDVPIVNENGDELGTNIFCKFKNSGNSPATQVNIINTIRFGANVGDCLAQIDSLMVNEDRYTSAVIGPNETCLTTSQELPANIIEMIMQGRTTAVYAVLATYRDIFNPETERRSESYQKVSFTRRRNDAGVSSLLPIFESIPERAEIVT